MQSLTAKPPQLSLFASTLPKRPYSTDDPAWGMQIRSAARAREKRFIQYNGPGMIKWLIYDIDRRYLGDDEWRIIARPNLIIHNPENGHAHVAYGLAAGVCTTNAAKLAPLRYLAAIDEGYTYALDADRCFTKLICKNPLHPHWRVEVAHPDLYEMRELAEYVDLEKAHARLRAKKPQEQAGSGRNCALFEQLRLWAYSWFDSYSTLGQDRWRTVVLAQAEKMNAYPQPLGAAEVRAIARSVAGWIWRKYSGKLDASSLTSIQLTPENFSLLQSNLGKLGMAKRWGNNAHKQARAIDLHATGVKQKAIAAELDVNPATVCRWLKPKAEIA